MSCCHIHTVDDFLNQGTLLSTELERLTLPESTEGGSPLKSRSDLGVTNLNILFIKNDSMSGLVNVWVGLKFDLACSFILKNALSG